MGVSKAKLVPYWIAVLEVISSNTKGEKNFLFVVFDFWSLKIVTRERFELWLSDLGGQCVRSEEVEGMVYFFLTSTSTC
jgi:hypothetical protein